MISIRSLFLTCLIGFALVLLLLWSQHPNLDQEYPDLHKSIHELITSRGFDPETHWVESEDGYRLQMVRIVNPLLSEGQRSKLRPVLLHHGLHCSGSVWLVASEGRLHPNATYRESWQTGSSTNTEEIGNSLGFVLATKGYDVWLSNYRGNVYSRNHSKHSTDSADFWNYSIDEQVRYDLPAEVDYIRSVTRSRTIAYVGHSQGNLMMLALMALRPEYATVIRPFIALSPVAFTTRFEVPVMRAAEPISDWILDNQKVPLGLVTGVFRKLGITTLCANPLVQGNICYWFYWTHFGSPAEEMDLRRLPVYLDNIMLGASPRNFVYFLTQKGAPVVDKGSGKSSDQKSFYPLEAIHPSARIALIYSPNDWFNHREDVRLLRQAIKQVKLIDDHEVPGKDWNHFELLWAKQVGRLVNQRILGLLERYATKR